MKDKSAFNIGIKPFLCHKCGKEAMFFDSDKKWYCGMVSGMGIMNSKGYCKNDKQKK
jgi:hypothetical protein